MSETAVTHPAFHNLNLRIGGLTAIAARRPGGRSRATRGRELPGARGRGGMTLPSCGAPAVADDLYSEEALVDSAPLFARIRDAGPVVWMPANRLHAIGRFEDLRAALRDDSTFSSGRGVAANPIANRLGRETTLNSDGAEHEARRRILMRALGAKALADVAPAIEDEAQRLIERLMELGSFEAVADFASGLPVAVVSRLVGVRADHRRMLSWAAATFEELGPVNRRSRRAMPGALGLQIFARSLTRRRVTPGSWAAAVFEARERGEVSTSEARALIVDLVAPALDTTILASAHMLLMLARHPDSWRELRADPALIPAAVVEAVRLASPIRVFTRWVAQDVELSGVRLQRGARVAMLYPSGNMDERRFPEPERFDIHRQNNTHLAWGNGPHTCVGVHLAKLEMQALLRAMVPRVRTITAGTPEPIRNNTLRGIARLPVSFA